MEKEPPDVQVSFADGKRALNRAYGRFLLDLRNKLGGHIDLPRVQAGLDSIELQHEGMAQLGNTREKTHYKFAVEIVWAAVLKQGVSSTSGTDIERVLGDTAKLSAALAAVDDVIAWYVRRRPL